ncbi:MAG TPA: hypothetical protein VH186_35830 [Chloroflexia bacterium]|nr:hypothetical protein [Chloroflexia bacterium]
MEVKAKTIETVNEPVNSGRREQKNFLTRSLSRRELTTLVNWAFRFFAFILAIYLLGQGTKWISAFVFGVGFAAVGIGVYLTFRILNFPDLTIEGSYTLGAAVAVNLISNHSDDFLGNPWIATLIAALCGGLAGFATGFLHTRLKINGLLASILVTTGLYSINLHVLAPTALINIGGKANVVDSLIDPYKSLSGVSKLDAAGQEWLRLGFFALVALGLILFFNWFLNTQLGLALRATGDNENMIRALGVNTDNAKVLILVMSNAMFGLAGAMLAQYLQYADGQFGVGMIVIGLAAVILGESFIVPRTTLAALFGALVGAVIYRVLFTGVFGLEVSWGLLLHAGLTLALIALVAYLTFLTLNSQTPAFIPLICVLLGAGIVAVGSTWLDITVRGLFSTDLNRSLIFKAEQYDIRLVLSVLIIVAMGVPALRSRIGVKVLKNALGK